MFATTRLRALLAALMIAVLALAACNDAAGEGGEGLLGGGSDAEDDPNAALSEALEATAEWDGISMAVSVASTPESLQAMAGDAGTTLSAEDAQRILAGRIHVESDGTDAESNGRFALEIDGSDVVEGVAIGNERFYVRVDLDALVSAVPELGPVDELRALLGFLGAPGVALGDGEWIVLDNDAVMEQVEAFTGQPAQDPDVDEAEAEALIEEMLAVLQTDVEAVFVENDDVGDRLAVTFDVRRLFDVLADNVETLGLPPEAAADLRSGDIPDELLLTADVWIDGGEVRQVQVDIIEVLQANDAVDDADIPSGVSELGLLIGLEEHSGSIDAPADATPVDLEEIFSGFFGGFGGPGMGQDFDDDFGGGEDFDFDEEEMFAELCEEYENDPALQDDPFLADICG